MIVRPMLVHSYERAREVGYDDSVFSPRVTKANYGPRAHPRRYTTQIGALYQCVSNILDLRR
jgi:hypothetical protein